MCCPGLPWAIRKISAIMCLPWAVNHIHAHYKAKKCSIYRIVWNENDTKLNRAVLNVFQERWFFFLKFSGRLNLSPLRLEIHSHDLIFQDIPILSVPERYMVSYVGKIVLNDGNNKRFPLWLSLSSMELPSNIKRFYNICVSTQQDEPDWCPLDQMIYLWFIVLMLSSKRASHSSIWTSN